MTQLCLTMADLILLMLEWTNALSELMSKLFGSPTNVPALHRSLLLRNSKESQNLCLPAGFSKHPVLVCEFNDCSLYILCAEKECTAWKIHLQEEVGDDGGDDNGAMMRMMMMICCHLTSLFSGCVQQQQCLARAASDSR